MPPAYAAGLEFAIDVASEAALAVRRFYDDQTANTYVKADTSPVTDADLASDRIIRARLARDVPDDAVLTEEGIDDDARLTADRVWIADPLDGTQQFVDRTGQFDVLLSLVMNGRPVIAVAVQPPTGLFLAAALGQGVVAGTVGGNTRVPLGLAQPGAHARWGSTIWLGAPETRPYLDRIGRSAKLGIPIITETGVYARSYAEPAALLAVAPGVEIASPPEAPLHAFVGLPLKGDGTMAWEWDFVTADLIVNEAGGRFTDARGRLHRYNKPLPRNQGGLISANTPELHARIVAVAGPEMDAIEALHRKE